VIPDHQVALHHPLELQKTSDSNNQKSMLAVKVYLCVAVPQIVNQIRVVEVSPLAST
jgi:hypothetical protein